MRLVDPGPVPPFDASAFATYDNEQDAAPLESELVEDPPERPAAVGEDEVAGESMPIERPPFRGKGYLRAEAPPEIDEADLEMSPDSAAADRSPPTGGEDGAVSAAAGSSHTVSADSSAKAAATSGSTDTPSEEGGGTSDNSSRGRRRRSRRRRRKPGENSGNGGEATTQSESAPQTLGKGDQTTSTLGGSSMETGDQSGESPARTSDGKSESDKPTGRRRRRRSRNRGRGRGDGDGESGAAS